MNKGVDKVRKSIEQRKKMRDITSNQGQTKHVYPSFPMEEEKHGYFPDFTSGSTKAHRTKRMQMMPIITKGVLALFLFVGTAFILQTESELFTIPKKWTNHAMTEEFPFARVHAWYQESFGSPMVSSQNGEDEAENDALALPVNGDVTETFQTNGSGIEITPEEATEVTALRDGIVIFAGKDNKTDNTVIIQHADGSKSTYGFLDDLDVHVYQFMATGESLGEFKPSSDRDTIFFAIEKDNQYMDPVQVIEVNEAS